MQQRHATLSWFTLFFPLGLPVGFFVGLLMGSIGVASAHTGIAAGLVFVPLIFGLIGFALDKREMTRQTWLVSSAILLVSLLLAAYIFWKGSGPVKGDMRRIETEDAVIIQRAESHWFFPNTWEVYSVTPQAPDQQIDGN
ncbi:MAG: hypothetical protein WEB58_21390 [Planctomycetaceae bacterium]